MVAEVVPEGGQPPVALAFSVNGEHAGALNVRVLPGGTLGVSIVGYDPEVLARAVAARAPRSGGTRETCSGRPPEPGHEDAPAPAPKRENGQHGDHFVLPAEARAKAARPVRHSYQHQKCGGVTRMPLKIAETYAADPFFYGSTFCCTCKAYFPVGAAGDFVWCVDGKPTKELVGT